MRTPARVALLCCILLSLTACNIDRPPARTPTPAPVTLAPEPTRPAATAAPTGTATPAAQPSPRIEIASASPAPPTPFPSPTVMPSATSPWIAYSVQEEDTMFYVLQLPRHGYGYEPDVAATVVALNDNIANADFLPVGQTILIPRPTATGTAIGARATEALLASIGIEERDGVRLPSGAFVGCHEAREQDTMVAIAEAYDTTLEVLSRLNQEINWFGCAFNQPSGGPDCNPVLQISQCVNVPLPTPRPTLTATASGDETATPTATHRAPRLLYPVAGARVPAGELRLQWIGLGGLAAEDTYLIELIDQETNMSLRQVSDSTDFIVPADFAPSDGGAHLMQWRVSVARADSSGVYAFVGARGEWRAFEWESR